jgi:YggT family protein
MRGVWQVISTLLFVFFVFLIGRLVLDWVRVFARDWRPPGIVLVLAEAVYTVTDPPLRRCAGSIPPLTLGQRPDRPGVHHLFRCSDPQPRRSMGPGPAGQVADVG